MMIGTCSLRPDVPAIMGIVNATPDSFSDGGRYNDAHAAVRHALRLVSEGADIVDVGGQSTRPGAAPVDLAEELRRVIPVIEGIRHESSIAVSIDTMKADVAGAAIEAGADMINDVSAGRFDARMFSVAAKARKTICLMHMQGTPRTMQIAPTYEDLTGEITAFLANAVDDAVRAGVSRDAILIDPGIGFGKTGEDNLTIIRELRSLATIGVPILVGTSRKSFIGKLLECEVHERLEGTLATLAACINQGAQVLRVHDVAAAKKFVTMYLACR